MYNPTTHNYVNFFCCAKLTKEMFIGFGTDFWNGAIFILPQNYLLSDIEFISLFNKQLPLIFTISGTCFAYFLYSLNLNTYFNVKKTSTYKIFYNFLSRKWYFDRFYNQIIGQNVLYYNTTLNILNIRIVDFGAYNIQFLFMCILVFLYFMGHKIMVFLDELPSKVENTGLH